MSMPEVATLLVGIVVGNVLYSAMLMFGPDVVEWIKNRMRK